MDVIEKMYSEKEKCTEAFSYYIAFRRQVPCGNSTTQFLS